MALAVADKGQRLGYRLISRRYFGKQKGDMQRCGAAGDSDRIL